MSCISVAIGILLVFSIARDTNGTGKSKRFTRRPLGNPKRMYSFVAELCVCPRLYRPLCASNGKTYNNMCYLRCAQKGVYRLYKVRNGRCMDLPASVNLRQPYGTS